MKKAKTNPITIEMELEIKMFRKWMLQKRYSANTIKSYIHLIEIFFDHYRDKSISEISEKDIEKFKHLLWITDSGATVHITNSIAG